MAINWKQANRYGLQGKSSRRCRMLAVALAIGDIQQRDRRWAIVDLRGKHGRIRAVASAAWIKLAVDLWCEGAGLSGGWVLRAMNRYGQTTGQAVPSEAALAAGQKGSTAATMAAPTVRHHSVVATPHCRPCPLKSANVKPIRAMKKSRLRMKEFAPPKNTHFRNAWKGSLLFAAWVVARNSASPTLRSRNTVRTTRPNSRKARYSRFWRL